MKSYLNFSIFHWHLLGSHPVCLGTACLLYFAERQRKAYKKHDSSVRLDFAYRFDSFRASSAIYSRRPLDIWDRNGPRWTCQTVSCCCFGWFLHFQRLQESDWRQVFSVRSVRPLPASDTNIWANTWLICFVVWNVSEQQAWILNKNNFRLCAFRYSVTYSVLPAPDSPETMIDWDTFNTRISRIALSAIFGKWTIQDLIFEYFCPSMADILLTNGENVRRQFAERLSIVPLDRRIWIQVLDFFVRIQCNQNVCHVCLENVNKTEFLFNTFPFTVLEDQYKLCTNFVERKNLRRSYLWNIVFSNSPKMLLRSKRAIHLFSIDKQAWLSTQKEIRKRSICSKKYVLTIIVMILRTIARWKDVIHRAYSFRVFSVDRHHLEFGRSDFCDLALYISISRVSYPN